MTNASVNEPSRTDVAARLDAIEQELRRLGLWRIQPPPAEAFTFTMAFAMDTMSLEQWLQFVFLPRVHSILESGSRFPTSSSVGAHAAREFDGRQECDTLVSLLIDFDALFSA